MNKPASQAASADRTTTNGKSMTANASTMRDFFPQSSFLWDIGIALAQTLHNTHTIGVMFTKIR